MGKNKRIGFTLIEVMVVVIILGAIVGLAIPRWPIAVERFRAQEADRYLKELLGAELRYKIDTGHFTKNVGSGDLALLDISDDINRLKHFKDAYLMIEDGNLGEVTIRSTLFQKIVGYLERNNEEYRLYIRLTGEILCEPLIENPNYCSKLGYNPYRENN
ncbi:MAG: prepilin-type N-terminal cleavage/methylation domain-containing protein [Candidatus Omnitrophica bacterium]|nr:prepilin-type N-terminal cleavage/methylation domain-containing protein [Candidatus Omnitrophota bacterium]